MVVKIFCECDLQIFCVQFYAAATGRCACCGRSVCCGCWVRGGSCGGSCWPSSRASSPSSTPWSASPARSTQWGGMTETCDKSRQERASVTAWSASPARRTPQEVFVKNFQAVFCQGLAGRAGTCPGMGKPSAERRREGTRSVRRGVPNSRRAHCPGGSRPRRRHKLEVMAESRVTPSRTLVTPALAAQIIASVSVGVSESCRAQ